MTRAGRARYSSAMDGMRDMAGEMMKALAVLALIFLNFAHAPAASAYDAALTPYLAPAGASLADCGEAEDEHAPCHACRIGAGAGLPGAPQIASNADAAAAPVVYAHVAAALPARPALGAASARGPPAA